MQIVRLSLMNDAEENTELTGLKVRIVKVEDDYLEYNPMYDHGKSEFCPNNPSKLVPVIKLYCTDERNDQRYVILVHNIYPYFYVSSSISQSKSIRSEILAIGCLLERMLGVGSVQRIIACQGTSLYGYWEEGTQVFIRISLFD